MTLAAAGLMDKAGRRILLMVNKTLIACLSSLKHLARQSLALFETVILRFMLEEKEVISCSTP